MTCGSTRTDGYGQKPPALVLIQIRTQKFLEQLQPSIAGGAAHFEPYDDERLALLTVLMMTIATLLSFMVAVAICFSNNVWMLGPR